MSENNNRTAVVLKNRGQILMDCYQEDPDGLGRNGVLGLPSQLTGRFSLPLAPLKRSRARIPLAETSGATSLSVDIITIDSDHIVAHCCDELSKPRFVPLSLLQDPKMRSALSSDSLAIIDRL